MREGAEVRDKSWETVTLKRRREPQTCKCRRLEKVEEVGEWILPRSPRRAAPP